MFDPPHRPRARGCRAVAPIVLVLAGCGQPAAGPELAQRPLAAATPPPVSAPLTRLYTLTRTLSEPGDEPGIAWYEVDERTGALARLGRMPLANAQTLAAPTNGPYLHASTCKGSKRCEVQSFNLHPDGRPLATGSSVVLPGNAGAITAADRIGVALYDDSSTGYAAGLVTYTVDAGTGYLVRPATFGGRSAGYSHSPRMIQAFGLDSRGSRAYVCETGGQMVTHVLDGDPIVPLGRTSGNSDVAVAVLAPPGGRYLNVLSRSTEAKAGYLATFALDASGVPAFQGALASTFADPVGLAQDGTGRRVFLSAASGFETYSFDPQTGQSALVARLPLRDQEGPMVVDATGRFLYVSRRNHRDIAAFAIEPSGELRALGSQGPGGGDLVSVVVPARN